MSTTVTGRSRELLKYTLWADRKLLAAARLVDEKDLTRDAGASFGSLLGTFAHVLGAEQIWLGRFVGNPLARLLDVSDYPDLEALTAGFEDFWPQMEFFMASLDEAQLQSPLQWTNSRGESHRRPLWQAVIHMVNHSTYHRGQIVLLLRQMGYQPPSSDLIYFFPEADP